MKKKYNILAVMLIALMALACSESNVFDPPDEDAPLIEPQSPITDHLSTQWALTSIRFAGAEETAVPSDLAYTIAFSDEGVSGRANCNSYGAEYTPGPGIGLAIFNLIITDAVCTPPHFDDAFVVGLEAAITYDIIENSLIINAGENALNVETLVFTKVEKNSQQPSIEDEYGTLWKLTSIELLSNALIQIPADEKYTIVFQPGEVNGDADCNGYGGEYVLSPGNGISISNIVTTFIACGPGSYDNLFMNGLITARKYELDQNSLSLSIDGVYDNATILQVRTLYFERQSSTPEGLPEINMSGFNEEATKSDGYNIFQVSNEGATLAVEVEYGGGCSEHEFQFIGNLESLSNAPAAVEVMLLHDDNEDACDGLVRETLYYDLSNLRQAFIDKFGSLPTGDITMTFLNVQRSVKKVFIFRF